MISLEEKYKNILSKNEKDSYYTYVSKCGTRANEKYHDSLSYADTDLMMKSTNYGALAENLNSSGLNRSGYEDYISSQNVKSYASKLRNADEIRQIGEFRNKTNYKNYISDYETMQLKISESVIKKIASNDIISLEDAYAEAVNAGISKNLAYATAKAGVDKVKESFKKKAVEYAKLNALTAEEAKNYAIEIGLDEDSAKLVYDEISSLTDEEKDFYSNMSAEEYYEYIKSKANK